MNSFYRLIKRKRNVRRLLAAGFFMILFAGLSLNAAIESRVSSVPGDAEWCDVKHHIRHSADCPHNRKPGVPEKDLFSETAHHWVLTADLNFAVSGILYHSPSFETSPANPISRPQSPPFQPPKQA